MPIIKKYNTDFFKTWSHEMAYVLGFICADGSIVSTKRGNYYVAIYTADKKHLQAMRRIMGSTHMLSERTSTTGVVYRIQIGSKEWFNDLARLGVHPGKAHRIRVPDVPKKFFSDFVRGYFDGDGNVWSGLMNKKRKKQTKVLLLSFTSASVFFLNELMVQLKSVGIHGGHLYTPSKHHFTRLTLATLDALKLYGIMYNAPCVIYLVRKKKVFEKFIKMRS